MSIDLKNQEEIKAILRATKSPTEWNACVADIFTAHGGKAPSWWKPIVLDSGLGHEVAQEWMIK